MWKRAFTGLGVEPDAAAMLLDDLLGDLVASFVQLQNKNAGCALS